ncbi:flavo protein-like protein [Syncephalastrum racemosum]|uniref:Flavo protein-like protein n=1 Tax=Syncephalastrum racemosum TaxID=13706 RepID=A0A1X2H774_SYNRA|nr:flavo protein-like protein [Syncephalastrum racemosum]
MPDTAATTQKQPTSSTGSGSSRPKVNIVIYSLYHHVYKLAVTIRDALEEQNVDAKIFQVQETLSDAILEKMHAPSKPDVPIMTVNDLVDADGLFFGIPTRFGLFPAQMKALLDATGQLWAKGALAGKFVATFFSTASQHGGQEATALNAVTYFAHHGMLYVPFGFSNAAMFNNDEVIGGSAYGAGTITNGDGSRQPSETELAIAKNQAVNFAQLLTTYHKGSSKKSELAADADASTKSLKGASAAPSATNSKETPVITTTNPEGETEQPTATGAAAGGTAAAGAGAAAAAATAAGKNKDQAARTGEGPTGAGPGGANGQPSTTAADAQNNLPTRQKPKKKKFWWCCGGGDQLD